MTFPPFRLRYFRENRFGSPRIARVQSSEELGTMSKNNLRVITLLEDGDSLSYLDNLLVVTNILYFSCYAL